MQTIVFSGAVCADVIQTRLRRQKKSSFFTVLNFAEQKFQVHTNWEMGHFSDPEVRSSDPTSKKLFNRVTPMSGGDNDLKISGFGILPSTYNLYILDFSYR